MYLLISYSLVNWHRNGESSNFVLLHTYSFIRLPLYEVKWGHFKEGNTKGHSCASSEISVDLACGGTRNFLKRCLMNLPWGSVTGTSALLVSLTIITNISFLTG